MSARVEVVPASPAIIRPPRRPGGKPIGPLAIMAATGPDFDQLRRRLAISPAAGDPLFMSRYCPGDASPQTFGLVGPFMGAPQAAMLLETIAAWGARRFVFFGWCGALASSLKSGDIVLPCGAFVDEGTSPGYGSDAQRVRPPAPGFQSELNTHFRQAGLACQEGWIWTTDAVFRETEQKVRHYQGLGALAVEMEISALYTVADHLGVDLGAVLVVSDELSTFKWRPGFKSERFQAARRAVGEAIVSYVERTQS